MLVAKQVQVHVIKRRKKNKKMISGFVANVNRTQRKEQNNKIILQSTPTAYSYQDYKTPTTPTQ